MMMASSRSANRCDDMEEVSSYFQNDFTSEDYMPNSSYGVKNSSSGHNGTSHFEIGNAEETINATTQEIQMQVSLESTSIENNDGHSNGSLEDMDADNKTTERKEVKAIKPIDKNIVHQICSGQVVVTLATAVKELIENALDAKATSVEVRLVDYGTEQIEVIDNGSGVGEEDFEGLAMKHHTSKITAFEDLASIGTYGFRGEALSSLCALSKMTVTTRSADGESQGGFRLTYDSNGNLTAKTPCHRESGTTICLQKLFHTLPVRHQEFLKNRKSEFNKMLHVAYGYALIAKGVRLTFMHKQGNNAFSPVFSIPSTKGLRERIVGLFGSKQLSSLLEIQQEDIVEEDVLEEFGLTPSGFLNDRFSIEGFVSKPCEGRGSHDRQYFFVNSRPCDIPKLSKLVNEVYHTFSRHQNPFICLNIKIAQDRVDVNVTPDKRQLYVQSEQSLFALVKATLVSMLATESSSYNNGSGSLGDSMSMPLSIQPSSSHTVKAKHEPISKSSGLQTSTPSPSSSSSLMERFGRKKADSYQGRWISTRKHKYSTPASSSKQKERGRQQSLSIVLSRSGWIVPEDEEAIDEEKAASSSSSNTYTTDSSQVESIVVKASSLLESSSLGSILEESISSQNNDMDQYNRDQSEQKEIIIYDDELSDYEEHCKALDDPESRCSNIKLKVDWNRIRKNNATDKPNDGVGKVDYAQNFHAKISPTDNAEQELRKQLNKDMFEKMEIVGQFNHGFIIAKLGSDLFIIDQHASDEKYNFENLQKNTVLQTQRLICPANLELPAISEHIVIDNLTTFKKNGFDFDIDPEAPPSKRVKLSQVPYSKSCQFGKEDIEELIFMLEEDNCSGESSQNFSSNFVRPSKIRTMLASRACRKSVMIGTALGDAEMRRMVNHMGEMNHPWNCPHGRPTIRHLFNLNLLPDVDSKSALRNHRSSCRN